MTTREQKIAFPSFKDYNSKGKIFNGMKLEIVNPPLSGLELFKDISIIKWDLYKGTFILKFCNQSIAVIDNNTLILSPQFYIHRRVEVFKTLNKLIRHFTKNYFLKMLDMKWHLCEENICKKNS